MKTLAVTLFVVAFSWLGLWLTPDQQGQRLFNREDFAEAAVTFRDPMRRGEAWFRAGEFEKAEQEFARVATSDAEYNRGNCLVMRGKYEAAIKQYDRALQLNPDREDAKTNRAIAVARAKRVEQEGGDLGDQQVGADKIVFDKTKPGGQETTVDDQKPISNSEMQALWLRRVQTQPSQFLQAKFSYQLARETAAEAAE
ncbi:Tetratricopeptide repeat protein [Thalassoglobus neptunius]|uniref:Tetratricopeptide repeat protein n=1 Tax=Thalassoglobus neptunius TaxID=1938619 RepID=A0A5C5W175_9PLAN|nr:tetratricopeptide repeat protein [Thalassoglobus neptunius]TWT43522.1 Tetratricopeptide repeat protein [Thalassoglobus neptunius]